MLVSSVHGSTSAPVSAVWATRAATPDRGATSRADDHAARVTVSTPGELLSQLASLQHRDPAQFKQLVQDIASRLHRAASANHGDPALTALATRFAQAAQSGDLSTLTTPAAPRVEAPWPDRSHASRGRVDDPAVSSAIATALSSLKQAVWMASAAAAATVSTS